MAVQQRIVGQARDLGGGFVVQRLLPSALRQAVGPFLFMDHFGPVTVQPDASHDVRPHPHIGLSTVSYLFDGAITHRDSLGVVQPILPGGIPNGGGYAGPTSEDCLTLNVTAPLNARGAPVMVWIPGGGNTSGGAEVESYDARNFARDGVILVDRPEQADPVADAAAASSFVFASPIAKRTSSAEPVAVTFCSIAAS